MSATDLQSGLSVVVMGTGGFILPSFEALLASRHRIVAVVTRPTHAPRKRRAPINPMREVAQKAGFDVLEPPDVNAVGVQDQLRAFGADIMLVCDYGQILSGDTLRATRLGGVNLHGSLLPRHRGAAGRDQRQRRGRVGQRPAGRAGDLRSGVGRAHHRGDFG